MRTCINRREVQNDRKQLPSRWQTEVQVRVQVRQHMHLLGAVQYLAPSHALGTPVIVVYIA